ncbi:carbamoyltransferase C-terminal domain-containing protein [Synechococcus sp. MIT S9452]|uniref:carbamoyltransferase C-terminal domain-containing protein n=1 Tax=Synechococcus sp. MIT S9452 TaxID=3082546 RepID=UPI0039A69697
MATILGLHGGYTIGQHEPSASLIIDGTTVAIYEEERFNRVKSSYGLLPKYSLLKLFDDFNLSLTDLDAIFVPGITYRNTAERWTLFLYHLFGQRVSVSPCHHQEAHAAAAFYGSCFDDAAAVTLDASGDGVSGSIYRCSRSSGLTLVKHIPNDESLGMIYTAITYHLGFEDGDEYKVMGLAPYASTELPLINFFDPDSANNILRKQPALLSPFDYPSNAAATEALTKCTKRSVKSPLSIDHKNCAKQLQDALVRRVSEIMEEAVTEVGVNNIVYAGGVALNCAANNLIFSSQKIKAHYVSPVASDRGLAYGCACIGSSTLGDQIKPLGVPYLGSQYDEQAVIDELNNNKIEYSLQNDICSYAAGALADGQIIGWFQGRSEAGARALGNRSILASATLPDMKEKVNASIKYREEFRPFAPVAASEFANEYWKLDPLIDYSTMTYAVKAKQKAIDTLPSTVHVDNTSRLQTVSNNQNPLLHKLLLTYAEFTSVPVLLNTSFNLKGQPIVESPRDALMTFYGCGIDLLIIGNIVITK